MIGKVLATLAAGAVLSLGGCHRQAKRSAVTAVPAAAPDAPAAAPATPTIALPPGSLTPTVTPVPTSCGAEKLSNYVNLIPTSTAKEEIARAVDHHPVRYVPLKPPPQLDQPGRVTAELGADGRIKKFICG